MSSADPRPQDAPVLVGSKDLADVLAYVIGADDITVVHEETLNRMFAALRRMSSTDPHPQDVARLLHETYERLAPEHGYTTREASAVPWEEVPEPNKSLMIAVAAEVGAEIGRRVREQVAAEILAAAPEREESLAHYRQAQQDARIARGESR